MIDNTLEADIVTPRLRLVALTPERISAFEQGREALGRLLDAHVPTEWPGRDYEEVVPFISALLTSDPGRGAWDRAAIHETDRVVIGSLGCTGRPTAEGVVEIGYYAVPAYRLQGYTAEAVAALVAWLWARPEVTKITATCEDDNIPSIRILQGLGLYRAPGEERLLHWSLSRQEAERRKG